MQLALRRSFGYAYAPPLNRGMLGLGDTCTDFDEAGDCTAWAPDSGSGEAGTEGSGIPGTPDNSSGETGPVTATVVDTSGVSWTCDSSGNCCNPQLVCQQGPPTPNAASASTAASVAAAAAAHAASPAAQLAATIASALARAVAPLVSASGARSCPSGYVYGAPGASVTIAPGVVTTGTGQCLPVSGAAVGQLIPGVSNTVLGIGAAVLIALAVIGGKK